MNRTLSDALAALLGDRYTTSDAECARHGKDESSLRPLPPEAVCFATNTDEVAAIVRLCGEHHTPVIPYGAGSSIEGQTYAPRGGVSLDLSRMNAIVRVGADDLDCTVQAGVTRLQLDAHLRPLGLFFPVDPGADATLGGMAGTRASGSTAVRYGTMSDNVLALSVVLPNGEVIHTGSRARKSSAGYDLTHLFVGAEGTLGVIIELTLRLQRVPEAVSAAIVGFERFDDAVNAVTRVRQTGAQVARIELLDDVMVRAVNRHSGLALRERPTVFFEFTGTPAQVRECAETASAITHAHGGSDFEWAVEPEARAALWKARHNAYFAALALRPGCRSLTTDVCVPISRLAECMLETQRDVNASFLSGPMVGHVGDGNFHVLLLVDPDAPGDFAEAGRLNARLVERALAMGGSITGEHGVGLGKIKHMQAQHGDGALALMRAIKHAVDPGDVMNPGKMLPDMR